MVTKKDPYLHSARVDREVAEHLIGRLEKRGRQPDFVRIRQQFLDQVPNQEPRLVLDVGCGTGIWARDMACQWPGSTVFGIDPSPFFLEAGRRFAHQEKLARVRFVVGEGHALPFPDGGFDVTLAATALMHMTDPLRTVKEMQRITRRHGWIAILEQDLETLFFAHPNVDLSRRILKAGIEYWEADGYIGRKIPGLLHELDMKEIQVLAYCLTEHGNEGYLLMLAERFAEAAKEQEVELKPAVEAWLADLKASARQGRFFASNNFYGFLATRED
ncbi:MAG: methyltransferase domain-containing protein [Acidobacteria bacterium]|nr:methyltransferase domain-containing protein [Acidobacteriota bacterium]